MFRRKNLPARGTRPVLFCPARDLFLRIPEAGPALAKIRPLASLRRMKFTHALLMLSSLFALFSSSAAAPLKVGDAAPAVTGVTDAGAKLNLADVYKQQTYTLVYFYPKADTPGCTKQGCSLRDGYEALTRKGVAVIGVSHDDVAAQKAFKDKFHLPFTLIADTDKAVITAFGVPTKTVPMMGEFAHRSAYLIKDGKIVYTDYEGTTDKQAQTILDLLAKG
jgi:peroxiredoxin Q/BCP